MGRPTPLRPLNHALPPRLAECAGPPAAPRARNMLVTLCTGLPSPALLAFACIVVASGVGHPRRGATAGGQGLTF